MKRGAYREPDYVFGQMMLTLRSAAGFTQAGLADRLGVSRQSIAEWEAGNKYPKSDHLKTFIALAMQHRAFSEGHEADEIRALWEAAQQKVLLNEGWLVSLLSSTTRVANLPNQPDVLMGNPSQMQVRRRFSFPFQPTNFVGRGYEIAELGRILRDPACHLLTLLGPGGVGKTRLALEVAAGHTDGYADGVAFVSLASINTPGQVVSAIADTLHLSFGNETNPVAPLLNYLRERHLLLVLDNFEHLLESASLVYEILEHAPRVTIVVTSRERLNLRAEWLFEVQGLSYPPVETSVRAAPVSLTGLSVFSAVQLFIQRATQVQPDFALDEATLRVAVRICQRVVGIPLAIELAASSVRVMTIAAIDNHINSNLDILATTLRDMPARHRSLRAVFDHSWNLLSESEQLPFVRLAVFRGGFTAEAAKEVADVSLRALLALVDKSLVRQLNPNDENGDKPRFLMLEPIREYALQKLDGLESEILRHNHALYFLALADAAHAQWETAASEAWLEELDLENDNLRAALQWTVSGGDAILGLRLAEVLVRYWRNHVYLDEARQWLENLLSLTVNETDLAAMRVRMRTTYATAMIYADQRDYARAGVLFEQSRALRHALGESGDEATMLINQAQQARNIGDYPRATRLLEESLALYTRAGDLGTFSSGGYGFVLYFLGHMLREQGEFARARAFYQDCHEFHVQTGDREGAAQGLLGLSDLARDMGSTAELRYYCNEALAIYREFGTQWAIGFCLNNLALAAYQENELTEAFALSNESVAMFREQKSSGSVAEVLITFGSILLAQGDLEKAYEALSESVRLVWTSRPRLLIVAALEWLAVFMVKTGQIHLAVQFLGVTSAAREQMGTPVRPADKSAIKQALSIVQSSFSDAVFEGIWKEANLLRLERVIEMIPGLMLPDRDSSLTAEPVEQYFSPELNEPAQRLDWDDAPSTPNFYGRQRELALLHEWIIEERCRVVSLLGLGGIGKSALAVNLMHGIADRFDVVIWRSLRDLPNCDVLLDSLLQVVAPYSLGEGGASLAHRQSIVLDYMRNQRILIVLDSLETLLEAGVGSGSMRPGFDGLSRFLRLCAETHHQSCVLLTSREKSIDLVTHEGKQSPVRVLRLVHLDSNACKDLLAEKELKGTQDEQAHLIESYAGNPLALKIIAQTIVNLFNGEIPSFLAQGEIIFGSIRKLLTEQYVRLPVLEQKIVLWLAVFREPATLDDLLSALMVPVQRNQLLEALESLHSRSLIEQGHQQGSFTLQSLVMEYLTAQLISEISDEIIREELIISNEIGVELVQSSPYVRQAQGDRIIVPILANLHSVFPVGDTLEIHLNALLSRQTVYPENARSYAAANLLTLLRFNRGDQCGFDRSF